jgi:hypothetical protein
MRKFKDPIILVPDTGFHLFFFPIQSSGGTFAELEANRDFIQSLDEGEGGWKSIIKFCQKEGDVGWSAAEENSHIRYIPVISYKKV